MESARWIEIQIEEEFKIDVPQSAHYEWDNTGRVFHIKLLTSPESEILIERFPWNNIKGEFEERMENALIIFLKDCVPHVKSFNATLPQRDVNGVIYCQGVAIHSETLVTIARIYSINTSPTFILMHWTGNDKSSKMIVKIFESFYPRFES